MGANPAGNIGDACKCSIALTLVSVFGMSAGLETAPSALAGGYAASALSRSGAETERRHGATNR
jgi:hypothetical protein